MIEAMLPWLDEQAACLMADRLPSLYPAAADCADRATGLVAVRLLEPGQYVLGFRPEWVHEVEWAGNPQKPVEIDVTSGEARLTARGSFEVWKQEVRGTARPWAEPEREAVADLQRELIPLQQSDRLRQLLTRPLNSRGVAGPGVLEIGADAVRPSGQSVHKGERLGE
jgi:light-regulated signal transduction histidine kinase (bacteriophytochrome)